MPRVMPSCLRGLFPLKVALSFFPKKKKIDYFNVDLLALSCIHKRIPYLT